MIHRLNEALKWLRANVYVSRYHRQLWEQVSRGEGVELEMPPLCIDGPEYMTVGDNTSIGRNAWLACYDKFKGQTFCPELLIGNNVRIGNYACITAIDSIAIDDGCLFSDYVYISDHSHDFDPMNPEPLVSHGLKQGGKVSIGKNTFVGMRVAIMPGVSMGDYCVIGTGSVVTRSFPAYSMVAGAPARLLKRFSAEINQWVDDSQDHPLFRDDKSS